LLNDKDVERVLFIVAHPDDIDFGAGGTVATFTDMGIAVSYCICTNGDAGGFDPSVPRERIAGIRQAEQRAAGKCLGVKEEDIHFLGYADGSLTVTMELRRDISRVIRQVKPQRVITQSSERNYQRIYGSHPDHMAAGEAALCAVYPDARNPFTHTQLISEGFQEWTVPETWIAGGAGHVEPNHFIDTTDQLPRKIAALLSHTSQTEHMGEDGLRERITQWNGALAKQGGLPEGRIAEAFLVVDTQ
jgi:LmbE family N-acetylglucosaminyl deacetylase